MGQTQNKGKGCRNSRLRWIAGQARQCLSILANLGYSIADIIRCPLTQPEGFYQSLHREFL